MEEQKQVPERSRLVQFLIKRWWGLSCLLLFIIFVVVAYFPHEIPSDKMRGGQAFLANYRAGASCDIVNPPESIEMVVSGGPKFRIEKGAIRDNQNELPYEIQKVAGGIRISMLDPNVSLQTAKDIWYLHADVLELGDGSRRYQIRHDVPLIRVIGVYVVKGNTITEHHFLVRNTYFVIAGFFLVIVTYLCGVIVRKAGRWIRGRRSANTGT